MANAYDNALGRRIARLREERALTQQALADLAGITRAQLARLERGGTPNPGVYSVAALAHALDLTLDELAGVAKQRSGPNLLEALALLTHRTAQLNHEPYDAHFTPAEFAEWSMGTTLSYAECAEATVHLNTAAIPAPEDTPASTAAAYFVTGAVAGALLERWRI